MNLSIPAAAVGELAPAYLQAIVTLGLAVVCLFLYQRYQKPYFGWWAVAWLLYGTRLVAIISFLYTGSSGWLYWHQVTTGWTALALLWAALVFSRQAAWKPAYLLWTLFPPAWSYVAIYRLDNFLLAAGPAVVFLSAATAWTAWVLFRYDREVRSPAARLLTVTLTLWALHHLDYPFLRAWGVWTPWSYYLDVLFELGMGLGILFLVLEDLDQGLRTLTALSGELQDRGRSKESVPEAVLRRALGLRGVHGSALFLASGSEGGFVHGAGVCTLWPYERPPNAAMRAVDRVRATGVPEVIQEPVGGSGSRWGHPYAAALPVLRGEEVAGALVVVGEARDPFTALDAPFLVAFGQQVGAALENEDLYRNLAARTDELERLQALMVRQHEDERERLSRELHDETAQVLAAVNMQLGVLREQGDETMADALDRARSLVSAGIQSIRSVIRNLRPTALDDLGLLPALRALGRDFGGHGLLQIVFDMPPVLPMMGEGAELALYRTLQEALANAIRHGECTRVDVKVEATGDEVHLTVSDDGIGFPEKESASLHRARGGLAGIRERITRVGGGFELKNAPEGGARVHVWVPVVAGEREVTRE